MERISFSALSGMLIICLGLSVILGWYFHMPNLITFMPNHINMVYNTALCFVMAGLALLISNQKPNYKNKIYVLFGTLILIVAGSTLIEYAAHISLGIDQLFVNVWHFDQNPYPGRMAISTGVAFTLTGLTFILFPHTHNHGIAILVQIIIFSIMLIGISAMLGYFLKLEFLYSWFKYTQIAIHTSLGLVVLSFGLGLTWNKSKNYSDLYRENKGLKIVLLSSMILISVATISGLVGFTISSNPTGHQSELSIIIFPFTIFIGILLLYWQVLPLINQIIQAKAEILESETKFRSAFDYSPIGIALVSLEGRWLKVNKSLCDIVGYSESELLKIDFQSITHPDDLEEDLSYAKKLCEGEIPFYQMEKRYIRKDKKIIWILLIAMIIRDEKRKPLYYVTQIQDINDKKKKVEALYYQAYYDTLTGLVNRSQLENRLEFAIASALRNKYQFAIFFIDLDNFKNINDEFGHDTGDQLLKIMGDRIRKCIRKTDIAARVGGDEFILILNGIKNPESAAIFAEKIIHTFLQPMTIKGHELFITASIGISFYPSDGLDCQALIKSADLALYKTKENGRNTYQFCTIEMNNEIKEKIMFKNALQTAFNKNEFYLVFLPKVSMATKRITGFEALIRWKSKQYGDVSPKKIISSAEEMGLISQLGEWIIKAACQHAESWQKFGSPIKLAINISTKHYIQSDFTDNILQILYSSNLSSNLLEIEISENLIMRDPDYSLKVIHTLKKNGVNVIIDNFGTGYSSVNYLYQFAVECIKIDRKFTRVKNDQQLLLLSAMIVLAKNLNIKILATGVESKEQYDLLLQLGCDEIQGYYISSPVTAEDVLGLLDK